MKVDGGFCSSYHVVMPPLRWRPNEACCSAPEEQWDDEEELTLKWGEDFSGIQVGDWVDIYCAVNRVSDTLPSSVAKASPVSLLRPLVVFGAS